MDVILLVAHVLLALGIITLVLLQKGKGATEGATFGGGAASVFGASGSSNFLSKTTAILATLFFVNSIALAYLAANRDAPDSVIESFTQQQQADQQTQEEIEQAVQDMLMPPADDVPPAVDDPAMDIPPPADAGMSDRQADIPPPADATNN